MRYSSYYLYRKYEKRDGQDVLPVIPTTYSIDGEGTMPKVLHLADDPNCGEIPWQYRWVNMDISTDYWCDECDPDYSKMYFTTVAMQDNVTITFNNGLDYSLDEGDSWLHSDLNPGATINAGERILWRGNRSPSSYGVGIGHFTSTGKYYIEGNPMSLLFGDNYIGQTSLSGYNYAFSSLFTNGNVDSTLVNAQNLSLPATTLSEGCYSLMFHRCPLLLSAPQLPSASLANSCYLYMFMNCSSLTAAPELPATSLAEDCYHGMFAYCTSLTTAPELPATVLQFTGKGCYEEMFMGCTSLVKSPVLSASTVHTDSYREMFSGCTSLNEITCLATSLYNWTATSDWVKGVSPSGTFKKASNMTSWTTGDSGIPSGWTVQNI